MSLSFTNIVGILGLITLFNQQQKDESSYYHCADAFIPSPHTSLRKNYYSTTIPFNNGNTHLISSSSFRDKTTTAYLFRKIFRKGDRNKDDNDNNEDDPQGVQDTDSISTSMNEESIDNDKSMFFASTSKEESSKVDNALTTENNPPSPSTTTPTSTPTPEMLALEQARKLREEAKRTRLQAEKMDITLTMDKIEKLTKRLNSPKVQNNPDEMKKLQESLLVLQKKLTASTTKESSSTTSTTSSSSSSSDKVQQVALKYEESEVSTTTTTAPTSNVSTLTNDTELNDDHTTNDSLQQTVEQEQMKQAMIKEQVANFQKAPTFMKRIVASAASSDETNIDAADIFMNNDTMITQFVTQMVEDEEEYLKLTGAAASAPPTSPITPTSVDNTATNDQSDDERAPPEFTQEQIDDMKETITNIPQFIKSMYGDDVKNNDTAIALLMLEEEWREGRLKPSFNITNEMIESKIEEVKWMPSWIKGDNETELAIALLKAEMEWNGEGSVQRDVNKEKGGDSNSISTASTNNDEDGPSFGLFGGSSNLEMSDTDRMVETLFPKSTRKTGDEPSLAQVEQLMSDVLTRKKLWLTSGPIEAVPGGYLLRGTPGLSKYEDVTNGGDVLIQELDEALEKCPSLRNQLSVFYIFDPTPVSDDQQDLGERPPLLYVTGSNVARDPAPVILSLVSGFGFATCWFTSIYPFLLNEKVMKLVDEQVALADASMPSNIEFVNDMAFPIFLGLVGIQFSHEIAHGIVAKANGLNVTFPTLVPSFTTGLSGAITSLKTPPKNKQVLFDFAISGPLTGMATSTLLLCLGLYVTMVSDAATYANLPALPLGFLRQSSLAGGIIEAINPGLLSVPDAALGSNAISNINIPLHPLAIAGYFGLLTNALNLLPIGRIDGGRIGLTLFGRSGSQLAGFITMVAMFIQGVLGSDVLLFFFSYIIFFQGELEIPQRNEVDDMDFSRVILATLTGVLVLLTLIPM